MYLVSLTMTLIKSLKIWNVNKPDVFVLLSLSLKQCFVKLQDYLNFISLNLVYLHLFILQYIIIEIVIVSKNNW